jgi:hypothetical protein
MAKYTQHFVDTLDLSMTPLEFFSAKTGENVLEKLRGYVGRFGITGHNQSTRSDVHLQRYGLLILVITFICSPFVLSWLHAAWSSCLTA